MRTSRVPSIDMTRSPRSARPAIALVVAALALQAGSARAQTTEEYKPRANWYGWQTLVAVAPFDVAMFAGLARWGTTEGTAAFAAGFAGRNLAPMVVHLAHGRPGRAFGSVGLHAGATVTGIAIGYAIGLGLYKRCPPGGVCSHGFDDIPPGPGYGAIAGSMVGTVLDVVFFGHHTRLSWTASNRSPTWAIAPYATGRDAGLVAGGVF